MAAPSVSVVVPSHNRCDLLRRTVPSVLADPELLELVVVVNGSTDGSLELLQDLALRDERVRTLPIERRHLGPARTAGVEAARGDVVLLLDDDLVAMAGLASAHARHHADRDDLVVMGYYPVEAECLRRGGVPARLFAGWYEAQVPTWEADPDSVLRGLWGGHVSLRREVALAVAPSVPEFYSARNQDRDWGLRLLKAGCVGRFDRSLRAEHLYQRSVKEFVRDHAKSGAGTWLVHELHADLLGHLPQDHYFHHLPRGAAKMVRLARRPRSAQVLRAAELAARLARHPTAVATALAMAQQREALAASRAQANGSSAPSRPRALASDAAS